MKTLEARLAREARRMTRNEVIMKAINGKLTWLQAADVAGITPRHMRRLKKKYEAHGFDGLVDGRGGVPRRKRIPLTTIGELCRLKQEVYPDFSVKHFHEFVTREHGLEISYNWTRIVLQEAGIVEKAPARGKYRRKRERRPMRGMLLHMDGSTHEWVKGLEKQDLVAILDDADGQLLYAGFFPEEGTLSTLVGLKHILQRYGRFCEFYTDRGSHFCRTEKAGCPPAEEQNGQVARVLKVLGIRHIRARSPQARGRSERAFGTIQGRLPAELRAAGITDYQAAEGYLKETFMPEFNKRFAVEPAQPETTFVPLAGIDLDLLLSVQHQRIVSNDNTISFRRTILQLPQSPSRPHYVRCPVTVHELTDGTLAVSYQGRELARYSQAGDLIPKAVHNFTKKKAA